MLDLRLSAISLSTAILLTAATAFAESSDWQKSYSVSAKPSIFVSTGDASTEIGSCGGCHAVRVRVEWNDRRPDDYTIVESQSGDHVNFELKEKQHFGMHFDIGNRRSPHVTVESPTSVDLEARTADGSLKVSGLDGIIQLHSGDGSVDVSEVSGALRLTASDGSIRIHDVKGTLESRSSDGSVSIEGRFTGLQVHTSDGSLEVTLADGSQLATSSRIESSDGSVKLRIPKTLSADLEVHTGDGSINCQIPLTMQGYNSSSDSKHTLRGRLNNGGTPLAIHTSDASVTISTL